MSSLTDVAENEWTDFEYRGQVYTLVANDTWELYTAAPGETGGGTVATYQNYAPVALARSLANWAGTQGAGTTTASSGSGGQTSNNGAITWPAPGTTNTPQTITHLGRKNNGVLRQYFALTQQRTIDPNGAAPSIAIAGFTNTIQ
jgi:hypothetical protein